MGGLRTDGLPGRGPVESGVRGGFGGPVEPPPRTGVGAVPEATGPGRVPAEAGGPAERPAAAARGTQASGHGLLPLGGVATRPAAQEHRRPDYLLDDTDAFADDRWFPPAVLAADNQHG